MLNPTRLFHTFSCDRETTFCLHTNSDEDDEDISPVSSSNSIFSRAKYVCVCRDGLYLPNSTLQGFTSETVEGSGHLNYSCIPCPNECKFCDRDGYCSTGHVGEEDILTESIIKIFIGSTLGVCFGSCLILSYLVFRRRKQTVTLKIIFRQHSMK